MDLLQRWITRIKGSPEAQDNYELSPSPEEDIKTTVHKIQQEMTQINTERHDLKIAYTKKGCKSEDEKFYIQDKALSEELSRLNELHDKELLNLINTFPLNAPATGGYVAKHVGVNYWTIETQLFEKSILKTNLSRSMGHSLMFGREESHYNVGMFGEILKVKVISNTVAEVDTITVKAEYKMKQPNWRFVRSDNEEALYIERYVKGEVMRNDD